ncbi:MAG: endonuclease domain-containing protein [Betaproteobacteria bacterium]|nr:endonuclease domain-containing protein [Betaproteobacteria bacterium]
MSQREFAKLLRRNMTDAEQLLWRNLRAGRFFNEKFRRQQPIGPYIVDFAHLGKRLIIEADGGQHNGAVSDAKRDAWLRAQGFTVMRFWNNDILGNLNGVLEAVAEALSKAPSPPAPLPQGARGE